jgi:hypothetical protein
MFAGSATPDDAGALTVVEDLADGFVHDGHFAWDGFAVEGLCAEALADRRLRDRSCTGRTSGRLVGARGT